MNCDDEGVRLTKAEIAALLAFCGDSEDEAKFRLVRFDVEGESCTAEATNGRIAVQARGRNVGEIAGSWYVDVEFLDSARKLLSGNKVASLLFDGPRLREAAINDPDTGEVSRLTWPRDAAAAQGWLPDVTKGIRVPDGGRALAPRVTIARDFVAAVHTVGKAATATGIDIYPPEDAESALTFRAEGDGTEWVGIILPIRRIEEPEITGAA